MDAFPSIGEANAQRLRNEAFDDDNENAPGVVEFTEELDARSANARKKANKKQKDAAKRKKAKSGGFQSMNLIPAVLAGILKKGFRVPTPIQRKAIPHIVAGRDVVAMARTGSGKTAAFVIPMLNKLEQHSTKVGTRAVILAPTRELAMQTFKVSKQLGKELDLKHALLLGGESMTAQFGALSQNPDIIIATPGRMAHLLVEIDNFSLRRVQFMIFDEADRLFEMGFADQINAILATVGDFSQTLLFSATMPKMVGEFARARLQDPVVVRLDTDTKLSENLQLAFFTMRSDEKLAALLYLLREVIPEGHQTLVFAATKYHCEFLSLFLAQTGLKSLYIFGSMEQELRKSNLGRFRSKQVPILIVTDVAARGIDIPLLDNVVNFDFPDKPKLFVHRCGRVARAGRQGTAYCLVSTEETPYMIDLHLFLGRKLQNTPPADGDYSPSDVFYGGIPNSLLKDDVEFCQKTCADRGALAFLQKTCGKAMKMYLKSRSGASNASVRRARNLPRDGVHPMLASKYSAAEASLDDFAKALKNRKTRQTIFETGPKSKKTSEAQVMVSKRRFHAQSIADMQAKKRRKLAEGAALEVRDTHDSSGVSVVVEQPSSGEKKFALRRDFVNTGTKKNKKNRYGDQPCISAKPEDSTDQSEFADAKLSLRDNERPERLEDAIMDMVGEDTQGIRAKIKINKWDSRKRRYIMTKLDEGASFLQKKVVNEAGQKIKHVRKDGSKGKQRRDIYGDWQKKSRKEIQRVGDQEGDFAHHLRGEDGSEGFRKYKHNKTNDTTSSADQRDKTNGGQLRSKHEIRAQRKKKIKNKFKNQKRKTQG